ncbi:MAG TPA: methyltransferase domain-containing protein [Thermoanaerobaculales bacterium]|nr:methyltransferase domain-containing protein [Thermoanaerobaculales bacterium]HPA80530.1 methyltransferase domain-containing protein [Thermoanaerobaculales bacterium]HQL29948.1 methyltransferase domain-containing protein [Thermoanaerobaculales bacterium]HQN94906.1 methyltransferase domain-containing protein [Thermoanaerobaculales bacterium]HQP42583.1 methyltransferase domain-containing protein [Thermoanaerobaculales bacterium]
MTGPDPISIRLLEGGVTYSDGSEERILQILAGAADRSSDSDELAAAITDWPSRYHLSRQRANLLRPLRLGPGMRVLEIGAGTGVLSRYLGETGARVVALEGSIERARAAALRCAGLPTVEVVCGSLGSFDDPEGFDLVCIVGVLEYAASGVGGSTAHPEFLARAAALRRPGGALLVAIENQLGVKYLVGHHEDHLALPWIGVEGYPGRHGIRTFSRRVLSRLLAGAGLPAQTWLYPFPDYKLPSVVLSDALYDLAGAPDLVDQLVRRPVVAGSARELLCDDRRAHRVMLEAGLGRDVANSFLVIATAGGAAPAFLPDPGVLAWRLGDDRRRDWRRHLELRPSSGGLAITTASGGRRAAPARRGWLFHHPAKDEPYVRGLTLEQHALEACYRGDAAALGEALRSWRGFLDQQLLPPAAGGGAAHPFAPAGGERRLPGEYLDAALSNFVLGDDGLHFIDREWQAEGGVDRSLVMARALWLFAGDLVRSGVAWSWCDDATVDSLAERLAGLCGLDVGSGLLDRMRAAEAELQHIVTGRAGDAIARDLHWLGGQSRASAEVAAGLPFRVLRQQISSLGQRLEALTRSSRGRERELDQLLGEAREVAQRLHGDLGLSSEQLAGTLRELEAHRTELAAARAENEMWRGARQAFERRPAVRAFRALRRLLGR